MKPSAVNRALALLLVVSASGAWAQDAAPFVENAPALQFPGRAMSVAPQPSPHDLLPDAPAAQPPTPIEKFRVFVDDATSPLTFGAAGISAGLVRESQEHLPPGMQSSFSSLYGSAVAQRESSAFFSKYVYPSLLKQDPRYHPSTSSSFLGRAAYAASRLLITRNDAGRTTLNTSYLLGVLTSAAVATAYRPYWKQSNSTIFVTYGSIIGGDAGMNLFHEFWPGIHRKLEGHAPRFVQRIEKARDRDTENDGWRLAPEH